MSELRWNARHKCLVVTRAGPSSLHPAWLLNGTPQFDLVVTAYSDDAPHQDGEIRLNLKGRKVAGYNRFFNENPGIFDTYEYIALIDDDIATDARSLNSIFRIGASSGFGIWQPSLDFSSYYTYGMTLRSPLFEYRITDYVEMMCPFFRTSALKRALPLFHLEAETGVDLVWSRHPDFSSGPCAIIDSISVHHTRPVGTTKNMQGFAEDEGYTDQINALLSLYNMTMIYPANISGRTGFLCMEVHRSLVDLAHATTLFAAVFRKHSFKYYVRSYYLHMRRAVKDLKRSQVDHGARRGEHLS